MTIASLELSVVAPRLGIGDPRFNVERLAALEIAAALVRTRSVAAACVARETEHRSAVDLLRVAADADEEQGGGGDAFIVTYPSKPLEERVAELERQVNWLAGIQRRKDEEAEAAFIRQRLKREAW